MSKAEKARRWRAFLAPYTVNVFNDYHIRLELDNEGKEGVDYGAPGFTHKSITVDVWPSTGKFKRVGAKSTSFKTAQAPEAIINYMHEAIGLPGLEPGEIIYNPITGQNEIINHKNAHLAQPQAQASTGGWIMQIVSFTDGSESGKSAEERANDFMAHNDEVEVLNVQVSRLVFDGEIDEVFYVTYKVKV